MKEDIVYCTCTVHIFTVTSSHHQITNDDDDDDEEAVCIQLFYDLIMGGYSG